MISTTGDITISAALRSSRHTKGLRILSVYTLSDGPRIYVDTARDRGVTLFWTVDEYQMNIPLVSGQGGLYSGINVQNRL